MRRIVVRYTPTLVCVLLIGALVVACVWAAVEVF
jgi:hypothetical protein